MCFEAAVLYACGSKFTDEAGLYNGGMEFREGGGVLGTVCFCFQALFTSVSVSRERGWTPGI